MDTYEEEARRVQRRALRAAIIAQGLARSQASHDHGDGVYTEVWESTLAVLTISWKRQA